MPQVSYEGFEGEVCTEGDSFVEPERFIEVNIAEQALHGKSGGDTKDTRGWHHDRN